MYPNLYYFFKDIFGVEWEWARFLNSFGFFVAISFLAAAYFLTRGLKNLEKKGLLKPVEETVVIGKEATPAELLVNGLLGFFMGYKIIGAFMVAGEDGINPQEYIFSYDGNWSVGILLGLFFAGFDVAAVNKIREHLLPYPPSSPCIALFKDGQVVHMIERHNIEGRPAPMIAQELIGAFEQYCS